ncbi:MAG: lysyl oxidase family protein [Thermoplasmatota archaeon]
MRALFVVGLLSLVALSGCIDDADEPADALADPGPASQLVPEEIALETSATTALWQGGTLAAPPMDATFNFFVPTGGDREPCSEDAPCEWVPITVPEGAVGPMTVAIEWEGQDEEWTNAFGYLGATNVFMWLDVFRDGDLVAAGRSSSHYAATAVVADPQPGVYEARVMGDRGTSSYLGSVTFGERPWMAEGIPTEDVPAGEAWPDLIMLPPDHVQISTPLPRQTEPVNALVNPGCGPDETAESLDRRCLRFAGILGNDGNGRFELRTPDTGLAGLPTTGIVWEQVLYDEVGSPLRRVDAGPADYHVVHGHFHVRALVDTQLYPLDEETGERGDPIGPGLKTGFCIIDGGLIDMRDAGAVPYEYNGRGCCYYVGFCQLDASEREDFFMGIMPGWYDIYPWYRADQYIEITGVPDGLYELVSVINPDQHLLELDVTNNEASTVIRLTGNDVEMLEMSTQADVGPHPDATWGYAPAS